jgi:ataxia telangiectasia mutated family protein
MSSEDAAVQTHVFLCLATIAYKNATSKPQESMATATWDNIWTYAMRRIHVPLVSRGACHVARVLLVYSNVLLSPQRVLPEIETIGRDLDIQGPPALHDSSCSLLRLIIKTAYKDVRLHCLRLEEKSFSWLSEAWQTVLNRGGRSAAHTHSVQDIFSLLLAIIGATYHVDLSPKARLPTTVLTDIAKEESRSAVIQNYLLYASLEDSQPESPTTAQDVRALSPTHTQELSGGITGGSTSRPPSTQERKASSLVTRFLDVVMLHFDASNSVITSYSIQESRRAIDLAVVAITYEMLLAAQGTRPARQTIQKGCKLISRVVTSLLAAPWTIEEKSFVLAGLGSLAQLDGDGFQPWVAMAEPGSETGIRRSALRRVTAKARIAGVSYRSQQKAFERTIWEDPNVCIDAIKIVSILRCHI